VRQITVKDDIGHANEVLVSVIPKNKDVRVGLAGTGFFFGQHNVEVAVAIEIGCIDGSVTAGENLRHNSGRECSIAEIHRRTKMIRRKVRVGREDQIDKTVAVDIPQLHVGEMSRRCVINRGSECAVTVILQNLYDRVAVHDNIDIATCTFLLKNNVHEAHPIYYPLVAAIYVLYGKPFKDTNLVGMLGDKMVPTEFRQLHTFMLKQRDQIYAHTDPQSFDIPDKGAANQLRVQVKNVPHKMARLVGTEFFARLPTLEVVANLCRTMQQLANARVGEIQARNFPDKLPKEEGEYPLNVFDEKGTFLLPKASDSLKDWSATT
jgi:hypothetical protein